MIRPALSRQKLRKINVGGYMIFGSRSPRGSSGAPIDDLGVGILGDMLNKPFTDEHFLHSRSSLTHEQREAIQLTINAIGKVITVNGDHVGSALSIGYGYILTSAHCAPDQISYILFKSLLNKVTAETAVQSHGMDYKILYAGGQLIGLPPAPLSVESDAGQSLHMCYDSTSDNRLITPYESEMSNVAARSVRLPFSTTPGESGAVQFSIRSKAVYAILQGEGEALKINDIFQSLMQNMYLENMLALEVMSRRIVNLEYLSINWSPIFLQEGSVVPYHGTLKSTRATTSEFLKKEVPAEVIQDISQFLLGMAVLPENRQNFYAAMWGNSGNMFQLKTYSKFNTRIDRQNPTKTATNLQFQYKDSSKKQVTVATVTVDYQLSKRESDDGISEVVKFVVGQFVYAIRHVEATQKNGKPEVIQFDVGPKEK